MSRLLIERRRVNSVDISQCMERAVRAVLNMMSSELNAELLAAVAYLLGRLPYQRRTGVASWIESGQCSRCKSRQVRRFSRNGVRQRCLLTSLGELTLSVPRIVCQCGGSVRLDFGNWLRPYQRLSSELEGRIQHWGAMCLSLRQMQSELASSFIGHLGMQTLLTRLHQLETLQPGDLSCDVPPILQIDAIWVSQLRPNGQFRYDAQGRKRAVKGRYKRPVLIALGVWPETGQSRVLAWQLAEDESAKSWLAFLSDLEAQGLRGQQGLQLIIHDGGTGLCNALEEVYFDADHQRCIFHKLRNIARAIKLPEELSRQERQRAKKAILKDFQAIWDARRYATVLRRYLQAVRKYRPTQPKAVATLRRDFRDTLAYYILQRQFPNWQRQYLRTTSHLERFNKSLRRHTRVASAYHSDAGILAMVAQAALGLP
jgi:hypothetical protein